MKLVTGTLAILVAAFAAGFAAFIAAIPAPVSTQAPARHTEDAIVVFTGEANRLLAAMAEFETGKGQRLLISGVHPKTGHADIRPHWMGDAHRFACCIDLGMQAKSTVGNANELSAWAGRHGFSTVRLVTSDYHMPRALLETRKKDPALRLIAHPVPSSVIGPNGIPTDIQGWRVLVGEYAKFLWVWLGTLVG
ncbi:MAG: YdcF family protein [Pseudomonadota bacterium]